MVYSTYWYPTGLIKISALILICLVGLANAADRPSILIPRQAQNQPLSGYSQSDTKPEPLRSMVSQKNLLGLDRDTPFGLPKIKSGGSMALDIQAETLKVLVLKIEFQTETPDDPTTTGNGNLDLRTYDQFVQDEGHIFDPAPHNSAYFSTHMQALARYYDFVSDRNLKLTWQVYPPQESLAIRLPHPMSYYGSGGSADSIIPGLTRYFEQAIHMADSLYPELDFSGYQSVILFHAGSDQQNNFYFIEDTPNDLWTGFIMVENPVEVDSGRNSVREGLIIPETACQDNRITCLNAVVAHEFGHQLGLVDIYNTANFLTQVGNFSLMDNNGMSVSLDFGGGMNFVSGTIPVYPDAWSRAYLGFSGVTEVTSGQNIKVKAAEQNYHTNEIIKVPISDQEYFLLENRQVEADFSYRYYSNPILNALLADSATGVILGPGYAYYDNNTLIKVPTGEYDRLLPGNGMLIWHVDEAVAYMDYLGGGGNNFLLNTLQWDHNRRFLSLVEADGIIDFGGNYIPYGYYGSDAEYYKQGNNTALTPSSRPNSHDNLGADSHVNITGIGVLDTAIAADTIMNCANISIDWRRPGFPQMGIPELGENGGALLAIDPLHQGQKSFFAASGNYLIAMKPDGSPFLDNHFGLYLPRYDGDSLIYNFAIFAQLDTNIAGKLIAGNFRDGDTLQIACVDQSNKLYLFDPLDHAPVDSLADLISTTALPAKITAGPLAHDFNHDGRDELLVGLADSTIQLMRLDVTNSIETILIDSLPGIPAELVVTDSALIVITQNITNNDLNIGDLDTTGLAISEWNILTLPNGNIAGMAAGDFDRDSRFDVVAAISDKLVIHYGNNGSIKTINVSNPGAPSLGDINSDGYPEIIFAAGDDYVKLYAFNYLGVSCDRFPLKLNYRIDPLTKYSEPLIADLDNDGNPDIVLALPRGGVDCYNNSGQRLPGFPLASSSPVLVPPCVSDIDADNQLEIAALDEAGFISAWNLNLPDSAINQPWPMAAGGFRGNAYLSPVFNKEIVTPSGFLADKSVYNYPNPAANRTSFRYYVDRQAQVYVTIYDMTGEKIAELTGSSPGGVESELVWDCSRYASGVYFASFEAKAANLSRKTMIKVALVK